MTIIYTDVDNAVRGARESRLRGDYTVVNKSTGVAYLSARDVTYEDSTGRSSAVRRNLEKQGYEVLPYWEQTC